MEPIDQELEEGELELPSQPMSLNMGPSHPAMHGTVRIVLTVDGEKIVKGDIQPGYLHRCFEKESEYATYTQVFPYTDRLNYVSPMINNVGWAMVVEKLYELFRNDNWKVRWVAASLVLKMSDASQIPEFMSKLGQADGLAITEPLSYGGLFSDLKGPPSPAELADKYDGPGNSIAARLTALSYYYSSGTPADLAKVAAFEKDGTATPKCKADAKECEWKCTVQGASGEETKEIKTVGDFVEFCVKPAIEKRGKGALK